MSYEEYSYLISEVSRKLDGLNRHEQLLFMYRKYVASGTDIPDALSLLTKLEERNHLEIDRLGVLKEIINCFEKDLEEDVLFQRVEKFEIKRKEYNDLLEQISRALDECNHLQQLIDICRRKTSVECANLHNVRALFKELENQTYFGFGHLDFLKEILAESDRQDLLAKVEDFEQQRKKKEVFERRKGKNLCLILDTH